MTTALALTTSLGAPSVATLAGGMQAAADYSGVARPTKRVKELMDMRRLPLALMGGTQAMRKAGVEFMPKHPAESEGNYAVRLASTHLYNGFAQTVAAQGGKLLGKPLVLNDNVPESIAKLADNIDGQGRAISPFALDVISDAFVCGVSYIWIDMPPLTPGATLADQRASGARPYWIHLRAEQVLGWRSTPIGGKQVLTQVRFKESAIVDDGEFGEKMVKRVRILERKRYRLFEAVPSTQAGVGELWQLIEEGPIGTKEIPIVPVYTNRTGYFEGEPALRAVAELNLEHWQSSSEQRVALSFLRFAMLAVAGVDPDTAIEIGPSKVLKLPAGATAGYVEHGGAGIESGRLDLEAIERRMRSAGMDIRIDNAGQVTATASALDSADSTAGLRAVGEGLADSLALALQYTAEFMGITEDAGTVDVNTEFADGTKDTDPATLLAMRATRDLSQQTLWKEMQRRHILNDEFDAEAEQKMIDAEPVPNPLQGNMPPEVKPPVVPAVKQPTA